MAAPPAAPPAPLPSSPITSRKPQVSLAVTDVQPPQALYVTQNDRLEAIVFNSVVGLGIRMRARILRPDGEIVPMLWVWTPTTDRSGGAQTFDLTEGWLLSVSIYNEVQGPQPGQSFASVYLRQQGTSAGEITFLLIQDYISPSGEIGWPGGAQRKATDGRGAIRSIAGTNPAAGSEISESVPTNARWRFMGMRFQLVTDATVGGRTVFVQFDDGANIFGLWPPVSAQTASQTFDYNVGAGAGFTQDSLAANKWIPCPVFYLREGYRIRTNTNGIAAGDDYGAPQMLVEEWIDV